MQISPFRAVLVFGGILFLGIWLREAFYASLDAEIAPVVPQEISDVSQEEENILVDDPVSGGEIHLPLTLHGQARVFENVVSYRLEDESGAVLAEGTATAQAPDVGMYGIFSKEIFFSEPATPRGFMTVYSVSPKDGSEQDSVRIPVVFANDAAVNLSISVARAEDFARGECSATALLPRRRPATKLVAHEALRALEEGVTEEEYLEGYRSFFGDKKILRSITLRDGVAEVLVPKGLFSGEEHACVHSVMHDQIVQTLEQFPTISRVEIREEGSDVLW